MVKPLYINSLKSVLNIYIYKSFKYLNHKEKKRNKRKNALFIHNKAKHLEKLKEKKKINK